MMQRTNYFCEFYSADNCVSTGETLQGDYEGAQIDGVGIKWIEDVGGFDNKMKSVYCVVYPHGGSATRRGMGDAGAYTAGIVSVFTEKGFGGVETVVDAYGKCSGAFGAGGIKSLRQEQGCVCHYYRSGDCTIENHVAVLRHDSGDAAWEAADLGEWAGKIGSFECDIIAPSAY